jgi:DNA-binding response OmpR family regulator
MIKNILYLEDENDLGNVVKQYMELVGFKVSWFKTAESAYKTYLKDNDFDLLIVDIHLPGCNGFDFIDKVLKFNRDQSFVFLTARNEKHDRLTGLKLGADDYISKPFDIDELVLRVNNILKRSAEKIPSDNPAFLKIGDVVFNQDLLKLTFSNKEEVILTIREAELLLYLYRFSNRVLSREEILTNLWGENDYFMGRSLDVFISRLRKALSPSKRIQINNIYGVGFVFQEMEM